MKKRRFLASIALIVSTLAVVTSCQQDEENVSSGKSSMRYLSVADGYLDNVSLYPNDSNAVNYREAIGKIIIFTFVLLAAVTSARAQLLEFTSKEQFKAYCGFLKDSVGINMKMPKGFYVVTSLNNEIWFNSDNNGDFRNVMSGLALTENQDRLIVYPFLRGYVSLCLQPCEQLSLRSTVNLFARDAVEPPIVKIITDGKLCGGADSVVIAEFRHKVKNQYMQDTEVDVLINKKNYIPAFCRIFFSEKGLKEKDSTIRAILKSVRYTSYDGFLEKARNSKLTLYFPIDKYLRDHKLSKYFATSLHYDEYFKYLDSKKKRE